MIKSAGKLFYRYKGFYPVTIQRQKFRGDPYHIGFWRLVNKGKFELFYFQILDKYLDRNSVYCDIGSWIGPTVMYASKICKKVYCFEPDYIAYKYLLQNIQLNDLKNVNPFNMAIGIENGKIKMASHGGNLGDSMTSMVNIDKYDSFQQATSVKWQTWLEKNKPEKIEFLKIDIEGGEFELLPTMKDYLKNEKPIISLSTHCLYIPEETRRKEMEKLVMVMSGYKNCFDEKHKTISFNEKTIDDCLNDFRTFLFVP